MSRRTDDPEATAAHQKQEQEERARYLRDLSGILETEPGRRVVWALLDRAGVTQSSFTGNSWGVYQEGRRSTGCDLLADIGDACPERFPQMWLEARKRAERSVSKHDTKADISG